MRRQAATLSRATSVIRAEQLIATYREEETGECYKVIGKDENNSEMFRISYCSSGKVCLRSINKVTSDSVVPIQQTSLGYGKWHSALGSQVR